MPGGAARSGTLHRMQPSATSGVDRPSNTSITLASRHLVVEADDVETATKNANFAGVKVKAIHPEEDAPPAVKLPPAHPVTAPGLGTPPPGYTGKVIIEREEDEATESAASRAAHKLGSAMHSLSGPNADAGTLFAIVSHIIALTLLIRPSGFAGKWQVAH